jgi:hypothetical protein
MHARLAATPPGRYGNFVLRQAIDRAIVQRIAASPPQNGLNRLNGIAGEAVTTPSGVVEPATGITRFDIATVARAANVASAHGNLL